MYRRITPLIAALTLAALLGAPGISAADTSLGSLWSFLLKAGCMIDPNGVCVTKRRVTPKEGCRIDPSGRCITSPHVTADEGCMIDPSGRCKPGS